MRISTSHETVEFKVFETQPCHTNSLLPTASSTTNAVKNRKENFLSRMNELMPWWYEPSLLDSF